MAKRTDVHSESNLRPEDYQVQEYLYTKLPPLGFDLTAAGLGAYKAMMDEFRATMNRVNDLLREKGAMIHGGWSSCDHCGAHYHHGVLLKHIPTDTYITAGWQCAEERFEMGNTAFQRKRIEKVMKAIRARRGRFNKLRLFVEAHPEVRLLSQFRTVEFFRSLRSQLIARLSLSDKQLDCIPAAIERQKKWIAERIERDARMPASTPVIEGRIEIAGEVLTAKLQDSDYGSTAKWLVMDDRGFKLWGTIPESVIDWNQSLRDQFLGKRVSFTAAVQRSKDDECFGFYKRPTKATLIEVTA